MGGARALRIHGEFYLGKQRHDTTHKSRTCEAYLHADDHDDDVDVYGNGILVSSGRHLGEFLPLHVGVYTVGPPLLQ